MAQFKKGEGGRPQGKLNHVTQMNREFIQMLLDGQQAKLKRELRKLTGAAYLSVITKLMEFAIPRLQRTEMDVNGINLPYAPTEHRVVFENYSNGEYKPEVPGED